MSTVWMPATEQVLSECQSRSEIARKNTGTFAPVAPTETTYYVSARNGSDENTGRKESAAWKSCAKLGNVLKHGDTVLFECGSVFRESVPMVNGVTYSSYGNGEKPRFLGSIDGTGGKKWEAVRPQLYRFYQKIDKYNDIGNLVFDDGKAWGIKIQKRTDAEASLALYDVSNGKERYETVKSFPLSVGSDLSTEYDLIYYHDDDGSLYLVCKEGNPGEVFSSVELGQSVKIFMASNVEDVTITNLHFSNIACFAIRTAVCKNLVVKNCRFAFIGGAIQFGYIAPWRNYQTRYGNAIENWGSCDGMTVENCSFYQIYDAAVSTQSNDKDADMRRVSYCGNVYEYCEYAVELWTGSDSCWFDDLKVCNSVCTHIGDGLCSQRPDKGPESFLNSNGRYRTKDCIVKNNLVWQSDFSLMRCNQFLTKDCKDGFLMSGNTYVHKKFAQFGLLSEAFPAWGKLAPTAYTEENVRKWVEANVDADGNYYFEE